MYEKHMEENTKGWNPGKKGSSSYTAKCIDIEPLIQSKYRISSGISSLIVLFKYRLLIINMPLYNPNKLLSHADNRWHKIQPLTNVQKLI